VKKFIVIGLMVLGVISVVGIVFLIAIGREYEGRI